MMYEYTNKDYEPQIEDYGDNYHIPIEVEEKELSSSTLLSKVKKLKRRYRNYYEYLKAMRVYEEYYMFLIDKYGSLEEIEKAYLFGTMDDFIPYLPELRMTKRNKMLKATGATDMYEMKDVPLHDRDEMVQWLGEQPDIRTVDVKFKWASKDVEEMFEEERSNLSSLSCDEIVEQLGVMNRLYRSRNKGMTKKKSVLSYKTDMMRAKYKRLKNDNTDDGFGDTLSTWLNELEEMEDRIEFGENPISEDDNSIMMYKDINITSKEVEEIEVVKMMRELGISLDSSRVSKKSYKIIRGDEKREKKKNKKNKKFKKMTESVTGKAYDSYAELERELSQLNGLDVLQQTEF